MDATFLRLSLSISTDVDDLGLGGLFGSLLVWYVWSFLLCFAVDQRNSLMCGTNCMTKTRGSMVRVGRGFTKGG